MKIAAYYIAKFRELFKNEIEKNLSARESCFLIAKRALGQFFWSISVYFVFVKRLDAPIVSKPPGIVSLFGRWYNTRSSWSIFHDFCLIFDFPSVRIIRTESRGAFWLNVHHYSSTDAVPGVLGSVLDIILRFPDPIIPLRVPLYPTIQCPCELNPKIPLKLLRNLRVRITWKWYLSTAELVLGGVMDWVWSPVMKLYRILHCCGKNPPF